MANPECRVNLAKIINGRTSLGDSRKHLFGFLSVLFLLTVFPAISTRAQQAEPGDIPPPAKVISKSEQAQLDAQSDVKKRTKLALDLMNARLTKAESLHDSHDLDAMFVELGVFHALVDHTLEFLNKSDKDSGKVLNNFKRFELGLRTFAPRLELIRRDLPLKYEFYVRSLAVYLRNARAKAVEPLFSDTIVPPSKKPD